ncbi:MAG: porin family protein [Bradyrhizobiaceae bacterium]|nr:porin family protein [Bradyrhizobiaceae bacterium]
MKLVNFVLVTSALSSGMAVSVARAADLEPKALPPAYLWSGFYVGGNAGAGWVNRNNGNNNNNNNSGFDGGGQIGYNFQTGHWVFGGEAEFSGADINNNNNGGNGNKNNANNNNNNGAFTTVLAARGGYAWDRWLIYGKVGGGWVDFSNNTQSGLAAGGGVEYNLGHRWSARVEYDHINLNNNQSFQSVKAGVNYKLGPGIWPFQ